jgi:hypothetical protein
MAALAAHASFVGRYRGRFVTVARGRWFLPTSSDPEVRMNRVRFRFVAVALAFAVTVAELTGIALLAEMRR